MRAGTRTQPRGRRTPWRSFVVELTCYAEVGFDAAAAAAARARRRPRRGTVGAGAAGGVGRARWQVATGERERGEWALALVAGRQDEWMAGYPQKFSFGDRDSHRLR